MAWHDNQNQNLQSRMRQQMQLSNPWLQQPTGIAPYVLKELAGKA
jgi:hypothetical protein